MKTRFLFQIIAVVVLSFNPMGAGRSAAARTDTPTVSTSINPASISVSESATATVSLNNVPAEGYTGAEFVCVYDPSAVETGNVLTTSLFGADAVVAVNLPQAGTFIVAIAGSNGNKATTSGAAFTFNVKGLIQAQTTVECTVRVSTGIDVLTPLPSTGAGLTILSPTPTPTETPNWVIFRNLKYGFEFKYPSQGQLLSGNTDNYARINLPFVPGTNLSEKYLEVIVAENVSLCQSPLATNSMLMTSEAVVINGIPFLKETGEDGSAGHLHKWIAYSTTHNNACISLDFIFNIINPGVFPTPPPLFDEAAESIVFGQIVSTYSQWLELIPTPTPTFIFTPTASPTATNIPKTTLYGQVIASKVVTVRLYNPDQSLVAAVNANPDGSFLFEVPPGTYSIVATANGFLRAQGTVTLTGGAQSMPVISLPAGDIDDDNSIDQFDAMTIGFNYGLSQPPGADLNNDGIINALDLELLAQHYRKTGPVVWQ
ncbi:MAG: carboxypeptidase regulatory-like domain-containing protein [Anaerolineales bacterium]|nr:carboxypeptidase regulatory-like domain-containing protein [Anaerolineales bacterium]